MQTWTFALQTIFYYIFHLRTDPTWTEYWLCRMFFICSFFFACFFRNASNMPGIQIPGNLIFISIISYQRWFTCFVFWCPIFIIFVKMFCFFDTCCMFLMHILYMLCHFFYRKFDQFECHFVKKLHSDEIFMLKFEPIPNMRSNFSNVQSSFLFVLI